MTANAKCGWERDWAGLYRQDLDLATPESNAHPAKMAWGLAFRILDHLRELGMLKDDDCIMDPMAGSGRTLIAACAQGLRAIGVELEPRFVSFSTQNQEYAGRKMGRPLDLTIIQGDARRLGELLKERGMITVTSPPYTDSDNRGRHDKTTDGWSKDDRHRGGIINRQDYGSTPGQIEALPDRPLKAIMSPPYAGDKGHSQHDENMGLRGEKGLQAHYGDAEAQIGNLPDRPLVSITSPPYEDSVQKQSSGIDWTQSERRTDNRGKGGKPEEGYGEAEGQIGQERNESYLEAMRQVYAQIALVSDVLVVVTKNPTRNGHLRRLDLDTISLLEATGWKIKCVHHAILFEEYETQTLFGETKKRVKGRMSFFKRLSYQKGNPVAQWEDIIFAV